MRKIADQYDELMNSFLSLVKEFLNLKFVKENPPLKGAVFKILNDPEIHQLYPDHRGEIIKITNFDPLDTEVPSAPKVKDEGPDFEERVDSGPGPDFEEHTESSPDKKETQSLPSVSEPSQMEDSEKDTEKSEDEDFSLELKEQLKEVRDAAQAKDRKKLFEIADKLGVNYTKRQKTNTLEKNLSEHINSLIGKIKPKSESREIGELYNEFRRALGRKDLIKIIELGNKIGLDFPKGKDTKDIINEVKSKFDSLIVDKGEGKPTFEEKKQKEQELILEKEQEEALKDLSEDELEDIQKFKEDPNKLLLDEPSLGDHEEIADSLIEESLTDSKSKNRLPSTKFEDHELEEVDIDTLGDSIKDLDEDDADYSLSKDSRNKWLKIKEEVSDLQERYLKEEISKYQVAKLLSGIKDREELNKDEQEELLELFFSRFDYLEEDYPDDKVDEILPTSEDVKKLEDEQIPSQEREEISPEEREEIEYDLSTPSGIVDFVSTYTSPGNWSFADKITKSLMGKLIDKFPNKEDAHIINLLKNTSGKGSATFDIEKTIFSDAGILEEIEDFVETTETSEEDINTSIKDKDKRNQIVEDIANWLVQGTEIKKILNIVRRIAGRYKNQKTAAEDYLISNMEGFNCNKIKVWASEINSLGTRRVSVDIEWDKGSAEGVYPWNIANAIKTYIHSLEASNYVQDENLGLIGYPRIVDLDLKKCKARVIVSSTNAESFPSVLVKGTSAVERTIKI